MRMDSDRRAQPAGEEPATSCLARLSGATVRRMPSADRFACAAATVLMEYPMAIMQDMASSA